MTATATRPKRAESVELVDLEKTPEFLEKYERYKRLQAEKNEAEALYLGRQRRQQNELDSWREARARAMAEGKPAPSAPEPDEDPELRERLRTLQMASAMANKAMQDHVNAESARLMVDLLPKRRELAAATYKALAALVDAAVAQQEFRTELESYHVNPGYSEQWPAADSPSVLVMGMETFRKRCVDFLGFDPANP